MCIIAIKIHGVDNVVEGSSALRKHLNVVVRTQRVKCAICKSSVGSFEKKKKKKKPVLTTKNKGCKLDFAKGHQQWIIQD